MEIVKRSYLFDILEHPETNDNDTINVSVADLNKFKNDCETFARFKRHPYYISIDETADYLNVSRITVYSWLRKGKIEGKKIGRKWMIREIDILDY